MIESRTPENGLSNLFIIYCDEAEGWHRWFDSDGGAAGEEGLGLVVAL
jgi:hypothetical protein